MKVSREILEDRLQSYEGELKSLRSYLTELKAVTTKHGTDRAHFEEDLIEAEHNIGFYEGEIAAVKAELGESPGGGPRLPKIPKQGVSSIIFSSVGFIAGILFGSKLKSRKGK